MNGAVRPAVVRPVAFVAVVLMGGSLAAGCGASPASPTSASAQEVLAGRVLDIVEANGIPVADDRINCSGSLDGRTDVCGGLTSTEPVDRLTGTFTAGAASRPGSCPGTLSVTVGPPESDLDGAGPVQSLTAVPEDPCR